MHSRQLIQEAVPDGLSAPPIRELPDPKARLDLTLAGTGSFGEMTFSHFFQQSSITTADVVTVIEHEATGQQRHGDWHEWVGWTWHPPTSVFENPPDFDIPIVATSRRETPLHATPIRTGRATLYSTPVPGSAARTRPISERRAFEEMLECVQSSAKKRASQRRPTVGRSLLSSQNRGVMPTPTPATRVQRPLSRQSTMLLESPALPSRPLSDVTNLSDLEEWHERLESSLKVSRIACKLSIY